MSREVPPLKEMLKLYSKKDLWDRIQEKNRLLDQRNHELAVMKKALELACGQIWAMSIWENEKQDVVKDNYDFFMDKAKEMLKDE